MNKYYKNIFYNIYYMNLKYSKAYPISMDYYDNQNFETFENTPAPTAPPNPTNKTLLGQFICGGLNYNRGMIGARDSWQNDIGVSYTDYTGADIRPAIAILDTLSLGKVPIIMEFSDTDGKIQAQFIYKSHYDRFGWTNDGSGPICAFDLSVMISAVNTAPQWMNVYRASFYPQYVTPGNPMATPSGHTKYTIVEQGEIQFFNNCTQVCLINDGNFYTETVLTNKSITALGVPNNTTIISYNVGPSQFNNLYKDAIYLTLSNTIDIVSCNGYFFLPTPPPTPPPTTPPPTTPPLPNTTPGPTTIPPIPTTSGPFMPFAAPIVTIPPTGIPTTPAATGVTAIVNAVSNAISSVVDTIQKIISR